MARFRSAPRRRVASGNTTSTFVPSDVNSPCTSRLALWPTDTIVVTAAMPMTTPSTVSPARILFFARARSATRTVSQKPIGGWFVEAWEGVVIAGEPR